MTTLERQLEETIAPLAALDEGAAGYRYEPGKWTVREVVGHVSDTERVFAYRLLRFARGDDTPLPGFEQDEYVTAARFDQRSLPDLLTELRAVRAATLTLLRGLSAEELGRRGTASGGVFTAAAVPWIIAGHELHHRAVLREQYRIG